MPDTQIIAVSEGIAEEINGAVAAGDFDVIFEASVCWANRKKELYEETGLRVDVVPINWTMALDADGMWKYLVRCQVGVRKKFAAADQDQGTGVILADEIKALVNLLASLLEMFAPKLPNQDGRALASVHGAAWVTEDDLDNDPAVHAMIDWDAINKRQFLGWFDLTY